MSATPEVRPDDRALPRSSRPTGKGAATSVGSARLLGVMAAATLTAHGQPAPGHQLARRERRRGSSPSCSKHASRFFVSPTPASRPSAWPSAPSSLGFGDATTYGPCSGARFLTRDPLESITREPYSYTGNNPINRTDPTGLDWWDPRDNVLPALGEAAQDTGEFVVRNRDTIVSVGAAVVCLGTIGTGCAVATATAVAVRSEMRFREHGINSDTVRVAVFDATLSWATLGLVRAPGQLATARLADPIARGVPVVSGRVPQFLIESGMSGLLSIFGFYARHQLDNELDC